MYQQIGSLRTGQTSSEISDKNKVRMEFKRQKNKLHRFLGEVPHPFFLWGGGVIIFYHSYWVKMKSHTEDRL